MWNLQKPTQLLASTLAKRSCSPQGMHKLCHGEQRHKGSAQHWHRDVEVLQHRRPRGLLPKLALPAGLRVTPGK